MSKSKEGKLFIIIICISLIAAVVISEKFDRKENRKTDGLSDMIESMNATDNNSVVTTNEDISKDENEASFQLLNVEDLLKLELAQELFDNLDVKIQDYINLRYGETSFDINKVEILEESIKIDPEASILTFDISLERGNAVDYGVVKILLDNKDYIFSDKDLK